MQRDVMQSECLLYIIFVEKDNLRMGFYFSKVFTVSYCKINFITNVIDTINFRKSFKLNLLQVTQVSNTWKVEFN